MQPSFWDAVLGPLLKLRKMISSKLFDPALADQQFTFAEWCLKHSGETRKTYWLKLATQTVLSAKKDTCLASVCLAKRCMTSLARMCQQDTGKQPLWSTLVKDPSRLQDPSLIVQHLLCALEEARQNILVDSCTGAAPTLWKEAACRLEERGRFDLGVEARRLENRNFDLYKHWRHCYQEAHDQKKLEDAVFFAAAAFHLTETKDATNSDALDVARALLSARHPSHAVDFLKLLFLRIDCSTDLTVNDTFRCRVLLQLASCLEKMENEKKKTTESSQAALLAAVYNLVSELNEAPSRRCIDSRKHWLREWGVQQDKIRKEVAAPLLSTRAFPAAFSHLLRATFDAKDQFALESFVHLYDQYLKQFSTDKIPDAMMAISSFVRGALLIIRQSIAQGAALLALALTQAASKDYALLVAHILTAPSTRQMGLQIMLQNLQTFSTIKELLASPWLDGAPSGHQAVQLGDSTAIYETWLPDAFTTKRERFPKATRNLLRPLRKYELAIDKKSRDEGHRDAAFYYFDMIQFCAPTAETRSNALLQAARHLIANQKDAEESGEGKFISFCLCAQLLGLVEFFADQSSLGLLSRMQIYRASTTLLLEAMRLAEQNLPGSVKLEHVSLVARLTKQLFQVGRLFPVFSRPPLRSYDVVLASISSMGLDFEVVHYLEHRLAGLLPRGELACLKLEGVWKGWLLAESTGNCSDEESDSHDNSGSEDEDLVLEVEEMEGSEGKATSEEKKKKKLKERKLRRELRERKREAKRFADTRIDVMDQVLQEGQITWESVATWIDGLQVPRTPEGFVDTGVDAKRQCQAFALASFDGFRLNKETGALEFLVTPASRQRPGLFDWSDVHEAITNGLAHPQFSLDAIDPDRACNPLQLMRFAPAGLRGTRALAAMFHADYLLKFFTCGVEISAYPPFPMRSTSCVSGLLSQLPPSIARDISVVVDSATVGNRAHRFWVDTGEFSQEVQEKENELSMTFGFLNMQVKKHLLRRNPDTGEVEDAPNDTADDSPEGQFALNFTQHYDAIGQVFPVFAQLREMAKIAHMVQMLQVIRRGQLESINELDSRHSEMATSIGKWLDETLGQAQLPSQKHSVHDLVEQEISSQGLWHQADEARRQLRPQVIAMLSRADSEQISSLSSQLASQFGCATSTISTQVRRHLRDGEWSTGQLPSLLATGALEKQKSKLRRVLDCLRRVRLGPERAPEDGLCTGPVNEGDRGWVPAVFRGRDLLSESRYTSLTVKHEYFLTHLMRDTLNENFFRTHVYNTATSLALIFKSAFLSLTVLSP